MPGRSSDVVRRGSETKGDRDDDDDDVLDASEVVQVVHPCGGTVRYSAIALDGAVQSATAVAMGDVSAIDATLTSYAKDASLLGLPAARGGTAETGNGDIASPFADDVDKEGVDMADVTIAFLGATARTCLEQVFIMLHRASLISQYDMYAGARAKRRQCAPRRHCRGGRP